MKLPQHIILFTLPLTLSAIAQDTSDAWSFQQCLDYAHEHNISIGQSKLSVEGTVIDLREAKEQLFPSLSFSTSHDYSQSPFADDPSQTGAVYNGSYRINASWTLFDGGKRCYDIRNSKLSQQQQQLNATETGYKVDMEILSTYLQILYSRETLEICRQSLIVSEKQEARGKALYEAGSIAKSDFTQLIAQTADDRYQVITAEANVDLLIVELKQLLNLGIETSFDILTPQFDNEDILAPIPERNTVLATALETWPTIQRTAVDEAIAETNIKAAKTGYYPTIAITAGLSTGSMSGGGTWGNQMRENFGESAGISLSLPIYDNGKTRAAVARARIEALNTAYDRDDEINTLTKAIESAYLDARSAQGKYQAAQESAAATADTYELISEQYELGIKNTFEMLTAQKDLLQARLEVLQAKYLALLNRKLLEFYNNIPLSLD